MSIGEPVPLWRQPTYQELHVECLQLFNAVDALKADLARLTEEKEALRKDAEMLDGLIRNEWQVWEVNGRYSVREVTEAHPITAEFPTAREAIDAAIKEGS